ncbi:MAG: hypothetical protein AAF499_08200, partial [Pseudomonadota bacterium]
MKQLRWKTVLCVCAIALSACAHVPASTALSDSELVETSGLAATRSGELGYWALNDGGHRNILFRLDARGDTVARLPVRGARNTDWEDLASFSWRGAHWLLIADVGDNAARRARVSLYLVPEPSAGDSAATVHAA